MAAPQGVLLTGLVTTIGRSSMNDLPIADKMLSRQHARHRPATPTEWLSVEDLGLAQRDVPERRPSRDDPALKPGDRITVGGVTLKVESESTTRVRIEGGRQRSRSTTRS